MDRVAEIFRETKETKVKLALNLDGTGKTLTQTGVGFFDHMLELLGRHSLIDLSVEAQGDLQVDSHHTVEDVGIVLGQALDKRWEISAGFSAMAGRSCRWMKRWRRWRSTCRAGRRLFTT